MIPALTGIALWRIQASGRSFPKPSYDTIYIGNNSNNALRSLFIAHKKEALIPAPLPQCTSIIQSIVIFQRLKRYIIVIFQRIKWYIIVIFQRIMTLYQAYHGYMSVGQPPYLCHISGLSGYNTSLSSLSAETHWKECCRHNLFVLPSTDPHYV